MSDSNRYLKSSFNRRAKNYDLDHFRLGTSRFIIETTRRKVIRNFIKGRGRLLDIGCGTGTNLKMFEASCDLFGTDISESMVLECHKKNLENVILADSERINFPDSHFDIIMCINAFQYFSNPIKSLIEMRRLLKPNGFIVISFWNSKSPRSFLNRIVRVILSNRNRPSVIGKYYKISELNGLFAKVNLVPIDKKFFNYVPFGLSSKNLGLLVTNFILFIEQKISGTNLDFFGREIMFKLQKSDKI